MNKNEFKKETKDKIIELSEAINEETLEYSHIIDEYRRIIDSFNLF
ncbi:hypothetical protein ALNOE001_07920 [Candidatus Methanobinarius endosymbioticus]|uniref:Uncharacterized protein n=1 Tax=Candidatus Methanobinarius endosymbioticus TaxID=2006182 RepID=A0A366MBW0_9EURY|nr:hypothetical protein ALNOE001_07920 [Candidatus Methanobinarius endosymbioticus]